MRQVRVLLRQRFLAVAALKCLALGSRAGEMPTWWIMLHMIQIRNVPDALHRRIKVRAALAGMSLSEYLLGEIR